MYFYIFLTTITTSLYDTRIWSVHPVKAPMCITVLYELCPTRQLCSSNQGKLHVPYRTMVIILSVSLPSPIVIWSIRAHLKNYQYIFSKKKFKTLLLRKVYYDCWLILWSAFNKVPTVPGKLGILSFTFPGGKCLKFAPKVWKTWNFNSKPEKNLNFENFMLPDNF